MFLACGGVGGAVKQADLVAVGCCLSHYRLRKVPSRELQMQEIHRGLQLLWVDMWMVLSNSALDQVPRGRIAKGDEPSLTGVTGAVATVTAQCWFPSIWHWECPAPLTDMCQIIHRLEEEGASRDACPVSAVRGLCLISWVPSQLSAQKHHPSRQCHWNFGKQLEFTGILKPKMQTEPLFPH